MSPAWNPRALGRAVGLLCALALVSGDLFRGLHLLAARHVVCAEHGELVHADDPAAAPSPAGDSPQPRALPGEAGEHRHHHCGLAAARPKAPEAAVHSAALAVRQAAVAESLALPEQVTFRRLAVLAYAPKQSPPA